MSDPRRSIDSPLALTAMVVTCNEARSLRACLESLAFCEQLLVVDLESTDESVQIARECGADVLAHERVPFVEMIWPEVVPLARHDWILRLDPDEVLPAALVVDLARTIQGHPEAGMIVLPHQYYFGARPIQTTIWGGTAYIGRVFHRERVLLQKVVHNGVVCPPGCEVVRITRSQDNAVLHYWVRGWGDLVRKHRRYIASEGEARYSAGQRFSWGLWLKASLKAAKVNLIDYRGIRGGPLGILLSLFYGWYEAMCFLSLRRYERRRAGAGR